MSELNITPGVTTVSNPAEGDIGAKSEKQVSVILSVDNIYKKFSETAAIDGVSLSVHKAEVVTLLGPSGCGKSTLLRCIAGIETIDSGEIRIGERAVSSVVAGINVPPEHRHLGMVFQSYALWPHMTVYSNVEYPLQNLRLSREERRDRVNDVLRAVQLETLNHRYPGELSGGQQQRVALARAIVGIPHLLLFDEPLSNLDARLRDEMRNEIKRLQVERNLTMLYVTHDQREALALSDRILVMHAGKILQEGSPESLYRHPGSLQVARFLGASNTLLGRVKSDGLVELTDGSTLPCQTDKNKVGDQVVIVCGPEAFRLVDAGAHNSVAGQLRHSGFLGREYEHVIRLRTEETITAHSRRGPFKPGTGVNVTLNSELAFAFFVQE